MPSRFRRRWLQVWLFALVAVVPVRAAAIGPKTGGPEILNPVRTEATVTRGNLRIGVESGMPRAIYNVGYAVRPGTPEVMARQYLSENRAVLGLGDPGLSDLAVRATRAGRAGTTVRFQQQVQGIPVLGPDVAVTIDRSNRVMFVTSGYQPGITVASTVAIVTAATARTTALSRLAVSGPLAFESSRLAVVPDGKEGRLVLEVTMVPAVSPPGATRAPVSSEPITGPARTSAPIAS